jgi:hypothetical protein
MTLDSQVGTSKESGSKLIVLLFHPFVTTSTLTSCLPCEMLISRSFLLWLRLPTHYRCWGLLLHLTTFIDTHSVGLLWTRNRPVTETSTCTRHNSHTRGRIPVDLSLIVIQLVLQTHNAPWSNTKFNDSWITTPTFRTPLIGLKLTDHNLVQSQES